jgi:putative ABC transport system permease protein
MLRKSLTVFQFAISVFLIVSTFIVRQQLYFIQYKKLGYDKEHVLVLPMSNAMKKNLPVLKNQFKQNPDVLNISSCNRSPMGGGDGYAMRSATMPENQQIAVSANPVDEEFVKTTGLQIIAGSDFTTQDMKEGQGSDKNMIHFIINESAAKQLGWTPQQAIGKQMFLDDAGYVKAVVKDYHFESLHNPIKPMVLFTHQFNSQLLVKLSGKNLAATIAFLATKWKALVPDRPFEYRFMDDDYNKLYNAEITLGEIMDTFAGIAIVLACLGLFGLSAYNARQRIKETGIRKVLGATTYSIVVTLSKNFILLTILSMAIAFPVAGWATTQWLKGFSYKTDVTWQIYFAAGVATVLLAMATVSFQAVKAALANPVKSLKTE